MDDLKLHGKIDKGLVLLIQTVRIFSSVISMEFGIDYQYTYPKERYQR